MAKSTFAVVAHPDDIEFTMAGTLILLKEAGYEPHYMTIGSGSCGSSKLDAKTISGIRREEAKSAAESIGAVFHESLVPDIDIFYEKELLARMSAVMREVAPDILLVHSPRDYMEDHTISCRLAVTAAFCRGMPNFPVDPPTPAVTNEITVYHAQPANNQDDLARPVTPDIFVDVTSVMEQKREMLTRHKSQKEWLDESQGMDSYLITMQDLMKEVGKMSGRYEFAEGWRKHSHSGFCSKDADPLSEALKDHCFAR